MNQIFQDSCSQDFITSLEDYSQATYNEDLHYLNFFKFVRPRSSDLRFSQKVAFSTHIATAKQHVLQKLDFLRYVKAIPHNQLDLVEYVSSSAAGYGYIGKKKDNYLLARRNATHALHGFAKYKTNYRFVPDKAFARSHLTSIATPKIRHVWGRAFHNVLIESLLGQPIVKALMHTGTCLTTSTPSIDQLQPGIV